jgi:aminocarboxymuconate-semialdehyde decarboxylase
MTVIDIHSHFFPKTWPDLAQKFGTPDWPWMKHLDDGRAMVMIGQKEFRPVYSACWDVAKRLEEMDRDGVDMQVMCATPVLFAYMRKAQEAAACAEIFNNAALEMCEQSGGRLKRWPKCLCRTSTWPAKNCPARCVPVTSACRSATTSATGTSMTRAW